MIQVSTAAADYISGNCRRFLCRLLKTDGAAVSGTVRSLSVNKGSCDSGSLQPGAIYSTYADVEIDNCAEAESLAGKKLEVQFGLPFGEVEWYTVGTYYAEKPNRSGKRTTLSLLGSISAKMGRKYKTSLKFPCTVAAMIAEMQSRTGITITLADGLSPDIEITTAPTNSYNREVLALIAGLYFGYATERSDGTVYIAAYGTAEGSVVAYPARMRKDPTFYDSVAVQGVQVMVDEYTDFVSGDVANASVTNAMMTQEIFDAYSNNYVGFQYTPYNMEMTLGDFRIEACDTIRVTDRETSREYTDLRCMAITHTYDGGLTTTISCPTLDEEENYYRAKTQKTAEQAYTVIVNNGGGGRGQTILTAYGTIVESTNTLAYAGTLHALYLNGLRLLPTEYTAAGGVVTLPFTLDCGTNWAIDYTKI